VVLQGASVRLRPVRDDDIAELARIRATPEVHQHWRGGHDLVAAVREDLSEPDVEPYVVELDGDVVGWIQWQAEEEPDYRHASVDIYLDPAVHGRGIGTDAVATVVAHVVRDRGHHRVEIDPATDNPAAIRCYEKVGFRAVGVMRQHERGNDGSWHDSLLMDLLADEWVDPRGPTGG
jgi:aminoglycoside 6'-N-acetyltransferase